TSPPTTAPPTSPPTTAPPSPPAAATVVDAVGDGGADAAHWNAALAARLVADRPQLLLWTGDVRDNGTPAEWALYDRSYGALKRSTLPTPGNHDWATSSTGYDVEFATDPYADTSSYCNGVTLTNGWGLFAINTYTRAACLPKLTAFLATPGNRKLVVSHEPRWSGGSHGPSTAQDPVWSAMKGHAFALVSGHDHDAQVIQADGMVQLVSGCAGASYYGVASWKVTAPAALVYATTSAADCTYSRLLLGSSSVTVEQVHADGSVDFRRTYAVRAQ
ncbi:MAG: metallophosphoesterase family protein, partial [Mycobacteriales bacterium]